MDTIHKIEHRIEELILLFFIIISILKFIDILPGDLDLLQRLMSWVALGYLVYKVSPTKLLFNNKHHFGDFFIIVAFFLLILKNLTQLAFSLETKFFNIF